MNLDALPSNIRSKILVTDDCWPWTGALSSQKYGHIKYDGRIQEAHRVVYSLLVGVIPDGMVLDHTCHDPATCIGRGNGCPHRRCVNPNHLSLTTQERNVLRGGSPPAINARKTACAKGHPYTPETMVIDQGTRRCLICRREVDRHRNKRRRSIHAPSPSGGTLCGATPQVTTGLVIDGDRVSCQRCLALLDGWSVRWPRVKAA